MRCFQPPCRMGTGDRILAKFGDFCCRGLQVQKENIPFFLKFFLSFFLLFLHITLNIVAYSITCKYMLAWKMQTLNSVARRCYSLCSHVICLSIVALKNKVSCILLLNSTSHSLLLQEKFRGDYLPHVVAGYCSDPVVLYFFCWKIGLFFFLHFVFVR